MQAVKSRQQDIIDAARACLGTPFHHQARVVGVGMDCIGLLVYAASRVGIRLQDCTQYKRKPDGKDLIDRLTKQLDPVNDAENGDILVFWIKRPHLPQHVAIKTDKGIIHTDASIGRVVEVPLESRWEKRLHSTFRFKGV